MVEDKTLTLREANMKVELLDEGIKFLEDRIDFLYEKTQPKPSDIKDASVQSSLKPKDKFLDYLMAVEEEDLIYRLNSLKSEQLKYINYINRCLEIMGKYGEIEKKIVYYKEEHLEDEKTAWGVKKRKLTWSEISRKKVFLSVSQCKKIYKKYKMSRSINEEVSH